MRVLRGLAAGGLLFGHNLVAAAAVDSGWVAIFNGKDLSGTYTFLTDQGYGRDPNGVFSVRDSLIHALPSGRGHLGYANTRINFHARVSWRFGPAGTSHNAGLMYHVDENAPKRNAQYPRSIECQMAETRAGELWTISGVWARTTIDPRTTAVNARYLEPGKGGIPLVQGEPDRRISLQSPLEKLGGWNTLEIIVLGDSVVHKVNGMVALRAGGMRAPDSTAPTEYAKGKPFIGGNLALQAEGQEVYYRKWEIRTVNPDGSIPVNPTAVLAGKSRKDETDIRGRGLLGTGGSRWMPDGRRAKASHLKEPGRIFP